MNLYMGGFAAAGGGTDGGWGFADAYKIYSKLTAIDVPTKIFVFLDMREDRVNWSNFMADMTGYRPPSPGSYAWTTELPGMYHNLAAGFSLADGHSETHRWMSRAEKPNNGVVITDPLDKQDWEWMQQRTSARH